VSVSAKVTRGTRQISDKEKTARADFKRMG
jgi:hypothetical protein